MNILLVGIFPMEMIREVSNNVCMCFVVATWGQNQPLTQRDLGDDTMNVQIWGKMGKKDGWGLEAISDQKSKIVRSLEFAPDIW